MDEDDDLVEDVAMDEPSFDLPRGVNHLICPDCQEHRLELRKSKYGLFYGCEAFEQTGCRGSVSADSNGTPRGIPAPSKTRKLRKQAIELLKRYGKERRMGFNEALRQVQEQHPLPIGDMGEEQARSLVHTLQYHLRERSFWKRLLED